MSDGSDKSGGESGDAADAAQWEWDAGGTAPTDGSEASAGENHRSGDADAKHRSGGTDGKHRTEGTDANRRAEDDAEAHRHEVTRDGDGEGAAEPLADLAREVRGRADRESEAAALFETVDVEEVDSEAVWSGISDADREDLPDVSKQVAGGDEGDGAVVPRGKYCGRCEYLADPPLLACRHEGTDIVAVVDPDNFEVRGCPFVETDDAGPGMDEGLPGRG